MNRVYKVIWSKARGTLVAVSEVDMAGGKGKQASSGTIDRRGEASDGEFGITRGAATLPVDRMRHPSRRAVVAASVGILTAGIPALGYAQAAGSVTVGGFNCGPAAATTNAIAVGCSANAAGQGSMALGFGAGAGGGNAVAIGEN
jgi:hypothetical protein